MEKVLFTLRQKYLFMLNMNMIETLFLGITLRGKKSFISFCFKINANKIKLTVFLSSKFIGRISAFTNARRSANFNFIHTIFF